MKRLFACVLAAHAVRQKREIGAGSLREPERPGNGGRPTTFGRITEPSPARHGPDPREVAGRPDVVAGSLAIQKQLTSDTRSSGPPRE